MKKKFTLISIGIVTVGLVYALAHFIKIESFEFAFALNFLLMACVLTFTETLKSQLNHPYFDEKVWEKKGKIYESAGINFYRKLLVWTGWEKLNKKAKPVGKNTAVLKRLYYLTKQDELGHFIIMIIVLGFSVFVAVEYGLVKSLSLVILNLLLNIYPVLLQRYNRPRIARALKVADFKASRMPV